MPVSMGANAPGLAQIWPGIPIIDLTGILFSSRTFLGDRRGTRFCEIRLGCGGLLHDFRSRRNFGGGTHHRGTEHTKNRNGFEFGAGLMVSPGANGER